MGSYPPFFSHLLPPAEVTGSESRSCCVPLAAQVLGPQRKVGSPVHSSQQTNLVPFAPVGEICGLGSQSPQPGRPECEKLRPPFFLSIIPDRVPGRSPKGVVVGQGAARGSEDECGGFELLISFPSSVLVHRSDPGPAVPLSLQVRGAESEGHFLRQEKSEATAFPVSGTKKGERRWIPASWSFPGLPLLPKAGVKGRSPPRPAPHP